jgi:hypothetical protein
MPYSYSEDQLVEQPAIQLCAEWNCQRMLKKQLRRTRDLLLPRLLSGQAALEED